MRGSLRALRQFLARSFRIPRQLQNSRSRSRYLPGGVANWPFHFRLR